MVVGSTEAGIDRERVEMDGTEIVTGYVSEGMYGDITEGTVRFTFDGYECCGSGIRYLYRGWQGQGKCRNGMDVGKESGELVGCIISMREDFIGED